jgi:hypothetical protein
MARWSPLRLALTALLALSCGTSSGPREDGSAVVDLALGTDVTPAVADPDAGPLAPDAGGNQDGPALPADAAAPDVSVPADVRVPADVSADVTPDASAADVTPDASAGADRTGPHLPGPEAGADVLADDAAPVAFDTAPPPFDPPPFFSESCQRACATAAPLHCPKAAACVGTCVLQSDEFVTSNPGCRAPYEVLLACAAARPLEDWQCAADGSEELMSGVCNAEATVLVSCLLGP